MSDGPFMSPLPEKWWNAVLERAANTAYSIPQLKEVILPALTEQARAMPKHFLSRLKEVLAPQENPLLKAGEAGEIEGLRREANGNAFALLITDWCDDQLKARGTTAEASADVLTGALSERWTEERRQLEEHAQREALHQAIAPVVRARLRQATPSEDELKALSRSLLDPVAVPPLRPIPKHNELEDGPVLAASPVDGEEDGP